ncbi:hypothetical protein [Paraburkholderia sp. UCT31]|uniref:hypothetical protein n=1 Tax=Paraburkholderia sp. UCT31 TaxID=2615209 RepID=UPI00223A6B30|nr:hypothetical protein [Paraburkholderia sp. UCT31]
MDDDVRLPGYRREQLAQAAYEEGVEIPDALIAQLEGRAQTSVPAHPTNLTRLDTPSKKAHS